MEYLQLNVPHPAALASLADVADRARGYIEQAKAPNTVKAYRSDWRHFTAWCSAHGLAALPADPETVALYLADLASTSKPSTLQRRISAISQAHQAADFDNPTRSAEVKAVWAGIRRSKGTAQESKDPTTTTEIRAMVDKLPATLLGTRDRALLLLGFAGAFRRSELTGLDVADIDFTKDGVVATLRRSKTDQEGEGRKVGIPYGSKCATCPVRALQGWLEASGIVEGPLFRYVDRHGRLHPDRLTDQVVAHVVKRYAEAAGLDPTRYAGHSLRSGLATAAAQAGASDRSIMNQTGHRTRAMVDRYVRAASIFRENAAAVVGL